LDFKKPTASTVAPGEEIQSGKLIEREKKKVVRSMRDMRPGPRRLAHLGHSKGAGGGKRKLVCRSGTFLGIGRRSAAKGGTRAPPGGTKSTTFLLACKEEKKHHRFQQRKAP